MIVYIDASTNSKWWQGNITFVDVNNGRKLMLQSRSPRCTIHPLQIEFLSYSPTCDGTNEVRSFPLVVSQAESRWLESSARLWETEKLWNVSDYVLKLMRRPWIITFSNKNESIFLIRDTNLKRDDDTPDTCIQWVYASVSCKIN